MTRTKGRKAPTVHELKTWPEYFEAIERGDKTFEVRKDDRGFKVGDTLVLREFVPKPAHYTGRNITAGVTYITTFGQSPGNCVMAIMVLKNARKPKQASHDR